MLFCLLDLEFINLGVCLLEISVNPCTYRAAASAHPLCWRELSAFCMLLAGGMISAETTGGSDAQFTPNDSSIS